MCTDGTIQHVAVVDLSYQTIAGSISEQLGDLVHLQRVNLNDNQLNGPIPDFMGGLANLTSLDVRGNRLTGALPLTMIERMGKGCTANYDHGVFTLPSNIGDLDPSVEKLQVCCLKGGSIPESIGSLTNLRTLDLSNDQLEGSIPDSLKELTQLVDLNLGSNCFNGSIPDFMGGLVNLTSLDVRGNRLTGALPLTMIERMGKGCTANYDHGVFTLPSNIGDLDPSVEKLQVCCLKGGSIPESIGSLTNLRTLDLSNDQLEGSIPDSLKELTQLVDLNLGSNCFNGSIPDFMGGSVNLTSLDVGGNRLTGALPLAMMQRVILQGWDANFGINQFTLPSNIGDLDPAIKDLDLSCPYNSGKFSHFSQAFTGRIPDSIGNLTHLQSLDLSSQNFVGGIPVSLGRLTALSKLDLSYNPHLHGSIPGSLVNMTALRNLVLDGDGLVGLIPNLTFSKFHQCSLAAGNIFACPLPPHASECQSSLKCNHNPPTTAPTTASPTTTGPPQTTTAPTPTLPQHRLFLDPLSNFCST